MREDPAFLHTPRALRHLTIALAVAVPLLAGCGSSHPIHPPGSSISGRVVNPQDHAVAGVEVRVGDRLIGVTDRNGAFVVRSVPANDRLAVSFSAPTFMSTTRIYEAGTASRGNVVIIWPRATPARLQASKGGTLAFSGGTIVFPPDAFVDQTGQPVTNDVLVAMSVLNIADPRQLASAPGDFTARMRGGAIRNLETFGLFELVLTDPKGRHVELAPSRPARVELQVRKPRQRELPSSVGSFSFEPRSGRWIEQSTPFQLQASTVQAWTATTQISADGWWNADVPIENTCMQVQVLGCHTCLAASGPVVNASVTATGTNYSGVVTQDLTDGNGIACLAAKIGSLVELEVSDGGRDHTMRDIATSPSMLSVATCTSCPLVTVTHAVAAPIVADPLTGPSSLWCASEGANPDPPFSTGWLDDQAHVDFSPSGLVLTMNDRDATNVPCDSNTTNCWKRPFGAGEYHTTCFHGYGVYTATITPPAQPFSGMVVGFFTYTDGNDGTAWGTGANPHDEIDIELLGRAPLLTDKDSVSGLANFDGACGTSNPLIVHTNYFIKGNTDGVNREEDFCLAYGTYTYRFHWTDTNIVWSYQDASSVWHTLRTASRGPGDDWPVQPGRVFMNIWASTSNDAWIGPFTYTGPKSAVFTNVSVP